MVVQDTANVLGKLNLFTEIHDNALDENDVNQTDEEQNIIFHDESLIDWLALEASVFFHTINILRRLFVAESQQKKEGIV